MLNNNVYGMCEECQTSLQPVWFTEHEYKTHDGYQYRTGRVRRAVDYLICPCCLKRYCVDDSYDGPWETPRIRM